MKIGEFAKSNDLSKETVRFYTEIGLLTPVKYRNFYSYGESCQEEINDINELKQLGYTLQEISQFLTKKRFSYRGSEQFEKYTEDVFRTKLEESLAEAKSLDRRIKKINEKIAQLKDHPPIFEKKQLGVPLSQLNKLFCPKCDKNLILTSGNISDQKIIDGKMTCDCGYSITIDKGILLCESAFTEPLEDTKPELTTKPITNEYASCAAASTNWVIEKIKESDIQGKTIVDLRTMGGTFSKKLLDTIKDASDDYLYIAIDPDYENIVEFSEKLLADDCLENIILCCGEYEDIPFRENIADYVVSFIGFQTLSLYYDALPFNTAKKLMKYDSKWYGCLYWVEHTRMIADKYKRIQHNLLKDSLMEQMTLFENVRYYSTGKTNEPGEIYFYFNENPEVFFNVFKVLTNPE